MKEKLTKKNIFTIPNALSLLRLFLIPVIVWLYCGKKEYGAAAAAVLLSAATDLADGKIARRFHMVSEVGKVLDPAADKLTQAALVICLMSRYEAMRILLMLFAAKEVLMLLWGYLTLKHTDTVNGAKWYGKVSTAVLYTVMMILILLPDVPETAANMMIACCGAVILVSLILYGRFYHRIFREHHVKPASWWLQSKAIKLLPALVWAALIAACLLHRNDISAEGILNYTPENPWMAAIAMMFLFALKSISIVVYSGILYMASGIMFPLPAAILVNLCGTVVMMSVPWYIGRRAGAPVVGHIREKYPKSRELQEMRKKNDLFFSCMARMIRMPSDIVSLYMGAVGVDYGKYLAGSILGVLPHVILYPIVGTSITDVHSPEFQISLCIELAYIALTVLFYALYSHRRKIREKKENTAL